MTRRIERSNANWETPKDGMTWEHATIEVLMDIRDELQKLNGTFACHRFQGLPTVLARIDRRLQQNMKLPKGRGR